MDDLGNIVYVVAAIGWFLWNTYKKSQEGGKKKQPAKQQKPTAQPKTEWRPADAKSLEELLREQLNPTVPTAKPMPVKTPKKRETFLKTDLTHSHLNEGYQMSKGEMVGHRVERQVRKMHLEEELEGETLMQRMFGGELDMQKAVVLNAILERPYR